MPPKTISQKPLSKRTGRSGILIALLIIVTAAWWTMGNKRENSVKELSQSMLLSDLSTVWHWCEDELVGGSRQSRWSFRWDGQGMQVNTGVLANKLGIALKQTDNETLQGEADMENGRVKISLWIHVQAGSKQQPAKESTEPSRGNGTPVQAVILMKPQDGTDLTEITAAASHVQQAVSAADFTFAGSFAVRGEPAKAAAASRIADMAHAKRQEVYNDGQTDSVTYFTPELKTAVKSGSNSVNLQMAEIRATGGGRRQIVIGVPLITGDYTDPD
ncbi:YwmB family TATA-box binding protein [Paenibacillus sp. sptzw28]|uniref:YwmB family TATA-box binding protein n=1 Tax=Paenibacillus sp. sptzw28 TaxID=715179 RepID=UPI001C6F3488|nr:YwmB family TATA-box binding protein [Paenibacillus sp. sptzw28]QYR20707.1 YwmB family TATA-box binding protein [Paenibacillus sp. sptzw28]